MENALINIDSKFRDAAKYPNPGSYTYILREPLKNISFIRLASIELPTAFYTFLGMNNNIDFTITTPEEVYIVVSIEEGNYDSTTMITSIQALLNVHNQENDTQFMISWNSINLKVTISNNTPFNLIFGNDDKHRSLGYRLGYIFDDSNYLASNQPESYDQIRETFSYQWTGDTFLNITKDEYLFVRINDYGVIYNSQRDKNLLAKIILYDQQFIVDNGANFLTKTYKFKQPVNLSKFDIELVSQYGYTVDMNYIDFSMTLEVGQIYDSGDYDKYNFNLRKR
tara:strand:- start:63 stop:908 length:846 start_codon:yes stop_codon:yes gene_type:complete